MLNGKCRLPESQFFLLENVSWTQEITWDRVAQCWGQALSPAMPSIGTTSAYLASELPGASDLAVHHFPTLAGWQCPQDPVFSML